MSFFLAPLQALGLILVHLEEEGALAWAIWTCLVADLETPSLLEDGTAQ